MRVTAQDRQKSHGVQTCMFARYTLRNALMRGTPHGEATREPHDDTHGGTR